MRRQQTPPFSDYDPNKRYTPAQLDQFADAYLKEDARTELCRDCYDQGKENERGEETGEVRTIEQEGLLDEEGHPIALDFPQFKCQNGHTWYAGEGKVRGIGGDNPILFREHIDSRKRREIMCANGIPDPEIVQGLYYRTHPSGRRVNSKEAREKHGASYYR